MELHNSVKYVRCLSPVTGGTGDTAFTSQIVDRATFGMVEFIIQTGTITDSNVTFTVLLEDGDNASLTDNAAVADNFLLGTEALAAFQYNSDNKVIKLGYKGSKRYLRMTITPSGNTGDIPIAVVAALGQPLNPPYTTQTV